MQGLFHSVIYHCTELKYIMNKWPYYENTYYQHDMNKCFSSKFAPGNPKRIIIVSSRFLICSTIAISQRFNLFLLYQTKNLFKPLKLWNRLVGISSTTLIIGLSICKYSWDSVWNLHKSVILQNGDFVEKDSHVWSRLFSIYFLFMHFKSENRKGYTVSDGQLLSVLR